MIAVDFYSDAFLRLFVKPLSLEQNWKVKLKNFARTALKN